ncbi:hypothetical protein [Mycolicibacterium sp. YH-1]|uniref:hypothetical protein n=1 Tax=Mycolicibacterium sp. YH-1 TaxID=2908837 RepID=UPI001F4C4822|nr:hypothetical protein [Mycolicibacterium sp. YH-1]UNB52903.1 hypothetical protein L0M16_00495 [Mycolicibacterium sp. YH-1]
MKSIYFLEVHSAAFDFSPCNRGIARTVIRLGDPAHPDEGRPQGLRQRCMYSTTTDHSVNGVIKVISTDEPANLAAVSALCTAHHGIPS